MNNFNLETTLALINDPKTPWGKVIGHSWSTDQWVSDYPISLTESIFRFLSGKGWKRTEDYHLLKPGDPGYNPDPYEVVHIL